MPTTVEYLNQLKTDKKTLSDNLVTKGVTVTGNETFTELAPKVLDIQSGSGPDEWFNLEPQTQNNKLPIEYIRKFPIIDTSNYTSLSRAFSGMKRLEEVNFNDTSKVDSFSEAFNLCSALKKITGINFSSAIYFSSTFAYCEALETIPEIDAPNLRFGREAFKRTRKLKSVVLKNTKKLEYMNEMFFFSTVENISLIEADSVINIDSAFNYDYFLKNFGGLRNLGMAYQTSASANYRDYTLDLSYAHQLTHESLMNVINNLYDIKTKGVQPQSLILGNNNKSKLTPEEIAIATNKGWNVS